MADLVRVSEERNRELRRAAPSLRATLGRQSSSSRCGQKELLQTRSSSRGPFSVSCTSWRQLGPGLVLCCMYVGLVSRNRFPVSRW